MLHAFRACGLVPSGFVIDEVTSDETGALITIRSAATASACPAGTNETAFW